MAEQLFWKIKFVKKVPLILHTKFEPNYFAEMDSTAMVFVIFKGRRKFSNGHCDLNPLKKFFIFISLNIKVLLILHIKFQPNVLAVLEKLSILLV